MKRFALALLFLSGCLPIPMKKTFVMKPGGVVRVTDDKGAPLVGAKVVLTRIKYPYGRHDTEWTAVTDAKGEVSFAREEKTETVYPLMMHGVPQYAFAACAEAAGYAGTPGHWSVPEDGAAFPPLELKLPEGERPCEPRKGELTAPPPGKAQLLSRVRKEADVWTLDLVLPKEEPIAAGVKLGGLEIVKVTWQSEALSTFRRATVEARGPGEKVHVGDLLGRE